MWDAPPELVEALHAPDAVLVWRVETLDADGTPRPLVDGVIADSYDVSFEEGLVGESVDLTIVDMVGAITPPTVRGPLTPYGQQVRIHAGAIVAGRALTIPVVTAHVSVYASERADGGVQLRISGMGRGAWAAERRSATLVQIPEGGPPHEVIAELLAPVMPHSSFRLPEMAGTAPGMILEPLDSRVEAAETVAELAGYELGVDAMGDVFGWAAGAQESGVTLAMGSQNDRSRDVVLLTARRELNPADTFSAVYVTSEASDAQPLEHLEVDRDPASPTWYRGPFGLKVFGYSSPLLTTRAQLRAAGRTVLARKGGLAETVQATFLPDFRLRSGDAVTVVDVEQGIDAVHRIAHLRWSSDVTAPSELDTRVRRIVRV